MSPFLRVGLLKETPSPNRESASTIFLLQKLPPPGSSPCPPQPGSRLGLGSAYALSSWPAHRQDTVISILVAGTLRSEAPLRDMAGLSAGRVAGAAEG